MSIQIRCPNCHRYFGAPDLESVKNYAASGGMFQTLTERIIAQPIINRYETPAPVLKAIALTLPVVFLSPAVSRYFEIDPLIMGTILVTYASIVFVKASTQIEHTVIEDEPGDEPEPESQEAAPMPVIDVTKPGSNSMSIRRVHEPPSDSDPRRQLSLARADLALAKLATATAYPMEPISWSQTQRRKWGNNGFSYGEKTFYRIVAHWKDEKLVFSTNSGEVYLRPVGRRTLTQYVEQNSIPLPHNSVD